MTTDGWLADIRTSYDTVAASYAEQLRDELDAQPYLRSALALFAELVLADGGGPVADIGCGPGHVTGYLRALGVDAFGIDLSPAMIEVARATRPGVRFEIGSMTDLSLADGSVAGVVAFWSLIHLPAQEVPGALAQFARVLRPGGLVLLGFHHGDRSSHKTEGYGGHPMNVYVHRRTTTEMSALLREAGFMVEAETVLDRDGRRPGALIFARWNPPA